jgi:hypothetical protein
MATTRAVLRLWTAQLVGDVTKLTATSNGTTTTFVDIENCAQQDDSLIGRWLYFTSGANSGTQRRVTDSVKSSGTLTFRAVTSTLSGDTAELYNFRNTGLNPAEIHDAINRAIESVSRDFITEVAATYTFDASSPVFNLDQSTWVAVSKQAEWQDSGGAWNKIPSLNLRIDKANRTAELRNNSVWQANGRSVRLRGYTAAGQLSADSSTTTIDAEWIVTQAAAWLLGANWHRRTDARETTSQAERLQARADLLRPAASVIPWGSTVNLG